MNPTDSQLTIGLDLGDRRHTACVLNAGGDIVTEEVIVNTRECLETFAARFPAATIIMETGTHSPWVSRLFEARGHRVYVANARKLRAISASHTKSDDEDAQMLARLGRADPKLLSPITHHSEAGQRELVKLSGATPTSAEACASPIFPCAGNFDVGQKNTLAHSSAHEEHFFMHVEVEQEEDGRWIAEVPALRGAMAYGASKKEAVAKVEALVLRALADKIEHGEEAPELSQVFTVAA